ncbi:hypothetical protein LTR78_008925 [Recurvomyces mirabilis]|uniref:DUF6604 domain-containing protein n=1 Tax=Recurvomyces mirabilis TaxID=574656 RepID=A0AAE0WGQ4_9PEZI|nr:hypothetical protein LTR78_008925 [Recurvomyces mirabilis]KAK5159726.1 hypothetical protein LTS14_001831 [Recurvomyces mirabilis]
MKQLKAKLTSSSTTKQLSKRQKQLSGKKAAALNEPLTNLFGCLNVGEPSELLSASLPVHTSAASNPKYSFKLETENHDGPFAIWCHLKDLYDFRQNVRQAWIDHKRGDISFLAASSLTDTAFGLLRRADHVVIDEFAQGLADAHQYAREPIWLVLACQIYLDAYDVLQTGVEEGAGVLQKCRNHVRQTKEDVDVLLTDLVCPEANIRQAYTDLHSLASGTSRVECAHPKKTTGASPKMLLAKNRAYLESGIPPSGMEQFLPGHAGALLADAKIGLHYIGCRIANHGLYILCMAHLYKSLRSRGLLKNDWYDMDFVLAGYGQKDASVPKADAEYHPQSANRHFLLAPGMPVSHFAANRRHQGSEQSPQLKKARQNQVTSQYLKSLSTDDENRNGTWQEHGSVWSKVATVERVLHAMSTINTKGVNHGRAGGGGMQVSFTPVQLLQTYRKSTLADESQLNFDYIYFTLACRKSLHEMVRTMGERLNMPPP